MTETTPKFERVMYELKPRPVTVKAIDDLTPNYRRIVFTGESLADFQSASPSDHIKFQIDVDGEPVRRDYTPRKFEHGELTLEFALHANGPVTTWARNAEIGSEATILGPRGSKVVNPVFDAYVFIGDDTLIPTVGRALEMLPPEVPVLAMIEVDGPEDKIREMTRENARILWPLRRGHTTPGETLLHLLVKTKWPEGEVFCWAGGEANFMKATRLALKHEFGVESENLNISGHWKLGESNFDHHTPIE